MYDRVTNACVALLSAFRMDLKLLFEIRSDFSSRFIPPPAQPSEAAAEALPAEVELIGSLNSLIASMEQLQSSFLSNPDGFGEGELAAPPRKILHTLR